MAKNRIFLIAAGTAATGLFFFGPGLLRWTHLENQRAQFQAEIETLQRENLQLTEEARRLREDPAYMEAVARQEMGFVRPGETVVKLKGQKR